MNTPSPRSRFELATTSGVGVLGRMSAESSTIMPWFVVVAPVSVSTACDNASAAPSVPAPWISSVMFDGITAPTYRLSNPPSWIVSAGPGAMGSSRASTSACTRYTAPPVVPPSD